MKTVKKVPAKKTAVKKTVTAKKITVNKKANKPKKKDEAVLDEVQKVKAITEVISRREVKYNYPEDCILPLDRKSWRQKVRAKLRSLDRKLAKTNSNTGQIKLKKEISKYQKEVLS